MGWSSYDEGKETARAPSHKGTECFSTDQSKASVRRTGCVLRAAKSRQPLSGRSVILFSMNAAKDGETFSHIQVIMIADFRGWKSPNIL
jgi:hypothetical protein